MPNSKLLFPRTGLAWFLFALILMIPGRASAQAQGERTLDEIKTEAQTRAENGMYPLIGLDPADVREAFASIHSLKRRV